MSDSSEVTVDRSATTRRALIGALAAGAVASSVPGLARAEEEAKPKPELPAMPQRSFGKTGRKVSLFGLGCYPLGNLANERAAVDVITAALRAGCTYIDTAPSYKNGRSERRVGIALRAWGHQRGVFLTTKTTERTADGARRDLDGSLKRLGVSQVDLVQVHAVRDDADLARVLDLKRGPLAGLLRAQSEGRAKYIGMTGHADPRVVRAAFERFGFTSVLMPLNCVDPHHLSFELATLPAAVRLGIGRVAMKVFSSGALVKRGISPEACLRYTYGLDVSTAIVGCRTLAEVELAARVARENKPLSEAERAALLRQTRPHKGKAVEWYKRT